MGDESDLHALPFWQIGGNFRIYDAMRLVKFNAGRPDFPEFLLKLFRENVLALCGGRFSGPV